MSVIVSWVNAPLISGHWVIGESNSVSNEISHARVGVLHVHFDSQGAFTLVESTLSHVFKKFEIFFD